MSFSPQPCPHHPTCDEDSITVCQGTVPWIVQGVEAIARDLDCSIDSVTVCPPVSGVFEVEVINQIPIRELSCETDSITICPPVTGTFDVNVVNQVDTRLLDCDTDSISVCQLEIFDVAVTGVVATNYEYPEDSLHVSEDIGAFILGVRNDNGSIIFTSDNGDYSPFAVDDRGRLQVLVTSSVGSPAADNNSIWVVSNAPASGSLATATRVAPGAGKQLVITSLTVAIAAGLGVLAGASVEARVTASGGLILWQGVLGVTSTVGSSISIPVTSTLPVPINEAVTIQFLTGVTGVRESVAMSGYISTV